MHHNDAVLMKIENRIRWPANQDYTGESYLEWKPMYEIRCPNCRRDFDIMESQAGKRVLCPMCEINFRAPEDDDQGDKDEPRNSKRRRKLKPKRPISYSYGSIRAMIGGGIVWGLGLLLLVIGVPMLSGTGRVGPRIVGYGVVMILGGLVWFLF